MHGVCIWKLYIHTYIVVWTLFGVVEYIHTYIHTYAHTYIHTYAHTYITYIHTYMHTQTSAVKVTKMVKREQSEAKLANGTLEALELEALERS